MPREFSPSTAAEPLPQVDVNLGLRLLAIVLFGLGALRLIGVVSTASHRVDFAHYYLSARITLEGGNPYTTPLESWCEEMGMEHHPLVPYGTNPPLLIRLAMLVAWMPPAWAFGIWLLVEVACLCGLIILSCRLVGRSWTEPRMLLWFALVVNSVAMLEHFYYSQVQLLVAVVITTATWLSIQGRSCKAVGLIALAAAFKLYPAVLLPWFMFRKLAGRSDFGKRCLMVLAVSCVALLVAGPWMWVDFLTKGIPVIQLSSGATFCNYSLQSATNSVFTLMLGPLAGTPNAALASWIGKGLALLSIAAAYWAVWHRRLDDVAAVGVLSVAMMAASIVCWSHYFVLLIPAGTWLVSRLDLRSHEWQDAIPAIIAFLILMPKSGGTIPPDNGILARLWHNVYLMLHLYPMLLMAAFAVCLVMLASQQRHPR